MKKNIFISFLSAVAKILGSVGLISILARAFTLSDFGEFTYTLTLATVFSLLVDYGYNIKIIKDVSLKTMPSSIIVGKAFFGKFFLFGITCILFFLSNVTLKNPSLLFYTSFSLFLSLITYSFTNVILSVFKGKKMYGSELKIVLIDNLLTFTIVAVVAFYTKDILLTAVFFFISKLIALIFALFIYYKHQTIRVPKIVEIKHDLVKALPYAIHYWVGSFYLNVDTLIMEEIATSEEIGIYQSGIRIVLGFGIILTVINAIYLPELSNLLRRDKVGFEKTSMKLNANVLRLGILASLGVTLFAKPIILILFGEKFLPLNSFLWVFALIIGMRIIGASYGILLTVSDKQRIRAIAGAISIFLIIICDSFLIPKFGYTIAAYVLLFAHLFINIFYILSVYFEYKSFFFPSFKQLFDLKNTI